MRLETILALLMNCAGNAAGANDYWIFFRSAAASWAAAVPG